jgi:hypothetical protein
MIGGAGSVSAADAIDERVAHPGRTASYARAAIRVSIGAALWIVNWLILRRQAAATARPST